VPSTDPDERRAAAQIASNTRLINLDADGRRALTASARAEMHRRDLAAVDPDGTLDDAERERRATFRRRQRMAELARLSAASRRQTVENRKTSRNTPGFEETVAEAVADVIGRMLDGRGDAA
jgi:hypothetical protein